MVGLPARGKTFIAQKLKRYLSWLNISTQIFNVGDYRRKNCGAELAHSFFDQSNVEANKLREEAAREALVDMESFFAAGGQVGIYDATNTTIARRKMVKEFCEKRNVSVNMFNERFYLLNQFVVTMKL